MSLCPLLSSLPFAAEGEKFTEINNLISLYFKNITINAVK